MTLRASIALASALLTVSCAASLMTLPAGPGQPAGDAGDAMAQALAACRNIRTLSAEISVSGQAGGRKMRARLAIGLAAPASAYIEAPAPFGAPAFIFAAEGDDATLLLPRDRRVLEHGRSADVLEAIAGVPLAPADLLATLTGCAAAAEASGGLQIGENWRVIPGQRELYLRRERATDPWRLVAVAHRETGRSPWRAEYRDIVGDLPRTIRLTSDDPRRFDLRLALSQVEINVPLDADTFRVRIPPGTDPITLQELRDAGPLAER